MSARWLTVLLSVCLFFLLSMVVAYRSVVVMGDNAARVSSTLNIISVIDAVRANLYAAESGQRGYLVTQDLTYLEPYQVSLGNLDELLGKLRAANIGLPVQVQRLASLEEQIALKLGEMGRAIDLIDTERERAAFELVRTDRGARVMTSIMGLLDEMRADEVALLTANTALADRNRTLVLATLIVTNLIGLILVLAGYRMNRRHIAYRDSLISEIAAAKETLEQQVAARTATLREYATELERSNGELETFAFVASHDLQEPLRKIRAFGDRLKQSASSALGDRERDYINRMQSASERMSLLINDLLMFSRVTTQQKPFASVDLSVILVQVIDDLQYALADADGLVCVDALPSVQGDAVQLAQVFQNLLGNAVKFRRPDVPPRVSVLVVPPPGSEQADASTSVSDWLYIEVIDNGIGFDQQYSDRMFNIFQRLHNREQYQGTGIGLALCRKIIERHGGTIKAQGAHDEGAKFTIKLPVEAAPEPETA